MNKTKSVQEEAAKKVKDLEDQLKAAVSELAEANTKLVEAEQELGAVRSLAATGTVINAIGQEVECVALVLGNHMEPGWHRGSSSRCC